MQVRHEQLELDMEKQTASKSQKEYVKTVYYHPAYLTYMQIIMQNARLDVAHTVIKIAGRNTYHHVIRYADDMTLIFRKTRRTKEPLDERERGE